MVVSFSQNGYHESNFVSKRLYSVQTVVKMAETRQSVLLSSPPFTGKTALAELINSYLLDAGRPCTSITFASYHPLVDSINSYVDAKTGGKFSNWEDLLSSGEFIIIDEFQKLYPMTEAELKEAYEINPEVNLSKSSADHMKFRDYFSKELFTNSNIKVICFSAYGSQKLLSKLATPFSFGCRLFNCGYFQTKGGHQGDNKTKMKVVNTAPEIGQIAEISENDGVDEVDELLQDFVKRTQIGWIRSRGSLPDDFRKHLENTTKFHVGFVAVILSSINLHSAQVKNEEKLFEYLYSLTLFDEVQQQRAIPSHQELQYLEPEEKNTLKKLLIGDIGGFTTAEDKHIESFIKSGWVISDQHDAPSIPCALMKDIIYAKFFRVHRLHSDPYKEDLEGFMNEFLSRLSTKVLERSLSLSVSSKFELLENVWCNEFYRIGFSLLGAETTISGQVQEIGNNRINGKVDFVLKNHRTWVVEFLVEGAKIVGSGQSDADLHIARFTDKYKKFSQYKYIVVDFRKATNKVSENSKERTEHNRHWIVYYYPKTMTTDDKGKKTVIDSEITVITNDKPPFNIVIGNQ
jgi:hypothetical protein